MSLARAQNERARRAWRRLVLGMIILSMLSLASLLHILGGPSGFVRAVKNINPRVFIASFTLLFLAEIVKSWRLTLIGYLMGIRVPVKDSLIARISGRFTGILTPAYAAATPTRAIIVSAYTGLEPGKSFGLAVYESLLDSFVPVTFTLILLIPLLPKSLIPVLIALFIAFMWIGGIGYVSTDRIERLMKRLGFPEEAICYVHHQRMLFVRAIKSSANPRILLPSLFVTLAAHMIEAYALYTVLTGSLIIHSLTELLKAFILLEASYVLAMSPTPGGALFFEYGLAEMMNPQSLLAWRIVFLVFSLLPGLIIVLTVKPVRRYIEEALIRDVQECSRNGENI